MAEKRGERPEPRGRAGRGTLRHKSPPSGRKPVGGQGRLPQIDLNPPRRPPPRTGRRKAKPHRTTRRPNGKMRRRRGGRKTLHYLLLLIFVIGAGGVLFFTVLFQIEEIAVSGAYRYSPTEVIRVSGIEIGENLLRLSTASIEEEILGGFVYISSVRIHRRFPHGVELALEEHQPEVVVDYGGEWALITLEGRLLERNVGFIPPGLPLVRGLSLEGYLPGDMIAGEDNPENLERLMTLGYLLSAADTVGFPPITNIDLRDRLNMRIVHEDRLLLELGSEAYLEYKLVFLQHVIKTQIGPQVQARLDATNAASRRLVRRDGLVIDGEFIPLDRPLAGLLPFGEEAYPPEQESNP